LEQVGQCFHKPAPRFASSCSNLALAMTRYEPSVAELA